MRKHTYKVLLKEFSKLRKYPTSSSVHTISTCLDLLFNVLHQKRNKKEEENFYKDCMDTLNCDYSPPIYIYWVYEIFIKTLIIMFISINVHIPYVCNPLGPCISLVSNSIDLIMSY